MFVTEQLSFCILGLLKHFVNADALKFVIDDDDSTLLKTNNFCRLGQ